MLRNDIIKKSRIDRKAYEMFVILGSVYDSIIKVDNLDLKTTNNEDDIAIARVIRNNLISLNEIDFDFFSEVMDLIAFLDRTAIFEREEYTANEIISYIKSILDKMYVQFDWYKEVKGVEMTQEEIVELLNYDCDFEAFANVG